MKRIALILITVIFAVVAIAQDRVLTFKPLHPDPTKANSIGVSYTGVAKDTLTAKQDTLQFRFSTNKHFPTEYYFNIAVDTLAGGAVDAVTRKVYGRMFGSQAWTQITTAAAAVSAPTNIVLTSMSTANYAVTFKKDSTYTIVPTLTPFYSEYMVELILTTAGTGKGIKVNSVDFLIKQAK
jgi:hypothetical protein